MLRNAHGRHRTAVLRALCVNTIFVAYADGAGATGAALYLPAPGRSTFVRRWLFRLTKEAGGTVAVLEATGPGRLRAFPLKHTSIPERTCGPEEGAQKRAFHQLEQEQGTRPAPSAPLAHDRPRTFQNVAWVVCWVAYGMMAASMPVSHCSVSMVLCAGSSEPKTSP